MAVQLKKIETAQDKDRFIHFPWIVYENNPLWVPPLVGERGRFLDPDINPFFEHAEADLYLALSDNNEPLGRIAVIDDQLYNEFHSESAGFFGMFESVEDQEVANLLLDKALDWSRSKGFKKLMGPMNLSTNHECGLLVEGFDTPPIVGIPYNPPYYTQLFNEWGLIKAKDLVSYRIEVKGIPKYLERASERIRKRSRFKFRQLDLDNFEKEIDVIWDIYNSAWSKNWGFVPLTRKEFVFIADELKHIIQPGFCLIAEVNGEPAGFSLTVPDINQILKTMDGKLFPFGMIKIYLNKSKIDGCRVLTLGVKKNFQHIGIDVLFYYETYKICLKNKIPWCDISWILEDNIPMLTPVSRLGAIPYKRHRIYERISHN